MRAIGFDTETTDLIRSRFRPLDRQPHIIEFFGLAIEGVPVSSKGSKKASVSWKEKDHFGSLFNHGQPLTADIVRITGIKDEMLAGQPKFKDKAAQVKKFIESADIIFAHNLKFDKTMVDFEMERAGLKLNWPDRMICTVEATEHFLGRRMKLIELHQHLFGEPFSDAHRAENDVRPMVRCFIELWKRGEF